MKKIDYEFFGEGQQIYFTIGRLAEVENLSKVSIGKMIRDENLNLNYLATWLSVGLSHHQRKSPNWYLDRIQELLDKGIGIDEINMPVVKALAGSGILGKEIYYAFFPEEITESVKQEEKK